MSLNDYNYSPTELLDATGITCMGEQRNASIGMGLACLNSLAKTGKEFTGDCDGLDALCYHLNGYACEEAIKSLEKVLKRFKEYDEKYGEKNQKRDRDRVKENQNG